MRVSSALRFLSSMPFGLGLFALVAVVSGVGSVMPDWGLVIYQSWWFTVLLMILVMNTGLCTVRQVGGLKSGSWRFRAVWLVHLSVLVVAVGCGWAALNFRMESITVAEGESFAVGAESWTLEAVTVEYYPEGGVSDWISTVQTPRGEAAIRVNEPQETGATKVLQSGYQKTYEVRVSRGDHSDTILLDQDVEAPLIEGGEIGFALTPPQAGLLSQAQAAGELPETADLLLTSQGRILQRTALFLGVPLDLGDTGLRLLVVRSQSRSTLLLRTTPGLEIVWVGFGLLALSITLVVIIPRRPKETSRA